MDIYAIILYMRRPGERCSQTVGVPATSFTGLRELAFAPVPMRLLLGLLLAGFAVAQYPQNSSIVLLFQAAGLPSGTLNTWPDASGNGYSAPNGGASATVTPFSRYCASSVVFTGTESYKTTSTSSNFYPSSNGFSFVALYKQSSTSSYTIAAQSRSMFSISVGTSASVGVGYGGTTASYTTSDTSSLHMLGGTLPSGSSWRQITGYFDNNVMSGGSGVYGSQASSGTVNIGPFAGNIYEIVVWKNTGGNALQTSDFSTLFSYYSSKYFLTCPAVTTSSSYTLSGSCNSSATDNSVCTATCNNGTSVQYGSNSLTCSVGGWNLSPPICQYTCPTLTQPANTASCTKPVLYHNFSSTSQLAYYSISPAPPAAYASSYWNISGGQLVTNAGSQCTAASSTYASLLFLNFPAYINSMTAGQGLTASFTAAVTSGTLGFLFRIQTSGGANYYGVGLNATGTLYVVMVASSVTTVFYNATLPHFTTGKPINMTVAMSSTGFSITANTTVVNVTNTVFQTGQLAFYSQGVGYFDDFVLTSACDTLNTCAYASNGVQCGYTCAAGYQQVGGSALQTCFNGTWSGSPIQCALIPPTFLNQTVSVYENATSNQAVGPPLNYSVPAGSGIAVTFFIASGNTTVFQIGLCNGQLSINKALLNYHQQSVYYLVVTAESNSVATAATNATITVNVLNVPHVPLFNSSNCSFTVNEYLPALTPLSPPVSAYDVDGRAVTMSIDSTSAGYSYVGINSTTGLLYTLYSYNTVTAFFVSVIASNGLLTATQSCVVTIQQVNVAPSIVSSSFQVYAGQATPLLTLGSITLYSTNPGEFYTFSKSLPDTTSQYATLSAAGVVALANSTLSLVTLPTGSFSFPFSVLDAYNFTVYGNVTITVIPAGIPLYTGLDPSTPSSFSTFGSQSFLITGVNLLTTDTAFAVYGRSDLGLNYTAVNCSIISTTAINCTTVPGVGFGLVVTVYYNGQVLAAGQSSGITAINYALPTLSTVSVTAPNAAALRTVGGDNVTITGTGFASKCSNNLTSVTFGGRDMTLLLCNSSTLIAAVPSGAGVGYQLSVTVALQTAVWSLNSFSYAPPAITALSGNLTLPTTGLYGSSSQPAAVYLTGTNFGPPTATVTAVYTTQSGGFNLSYTASSCNVNGAQTVLTCYAVAGIGSNFTWAVTVAGQSSGQSQQSTSYPPPSLAAVSGVGAVGGSTAGGQIVTLTGLNFGPTYAGHTSIMNSTYGPTGFEYTAQSCQVTSSTPSTSTATCNTAPGIGANLVWRVCIAGQCSGFAGNTSYGRPIVAFFSGDGAVAATTVGDQEVYVHGSNFGPIGTFVTAVYTTGDTGSSVIQASTVIQQPSYWTLTAGDIATYGLDGTTVTYPALNCSVVEDHVTVLCYSTEGAGNGLAWILTVGGQASQSPVTSYAIPNITNIGLATSTGVPLPMSALDTRGLVYAVINGSNFGPVWPRAYVSSVMFGPYNVPNCTMPIPHSQILCPIVPGVGVGLRWMVSVLGQSIVSSQTLSYGPPVLNSTSPASIPTTGSAVTVTGLNFGYQPGYITVYVNGAPFPDFQITTSHVALNLAIPEVVGVSVISVQVVVDSQSSNVIQIPVQPPAISLIDITDTSDYTPAQFAADPCAVYAASLNAVPPAVILEIDGSNFGQSSAYTSVAMTNGTTNPVCTVCAVTDAQVRCVSTAAHNVQWNVTVTTVNQTSAPSMYWYQAIMSPPSVSTVLPRRGPTAGNVLVSISGVNFKDRGSVTMTNEDTTMTCATPAFGTSGNVSGPYWSPSGTLIQCLVPSGTGTGYSFLVTARNVLGTPTVATFSYDPPIITSISPRWLNTSGGEVTISGLNFGGPVNTSVLSLSAALAAANRSLSLDSAACVPTVWNDSTIVCMLGPGVVRDVSVVVNVSAQTNAVSTGFVGYYPPLLLSISPDAGPALGGTVVTFTGVNFGATAVPLTFTLANPSQGITGVTCTVLAHTHTSGTCTMSQGGGFDLTITTSTPSQSAQSGSVMYSYDPPSITSIGGRSDSNPFGVGGGFVVEIWGESFTSQAAALLNGLPCGISYNNDSFITCTAPAGFGRGNNIEVIAFDQSSGGFEFDYDPPMITAVSPTTIDALDGSALNISGVNFAPINSDPTVHAQVFVGSVSCAVQFMSSSAILCLSARSQLIGPSNLTVLTWRTGIANESTSAGPDALNSQLSLAVAVNLSCPVNYYGLVGNFCSLCPVEAYCAGGLALPVALPGYYRVGITDFLQCSPAIACPGYVNDTSAQSQCAAGYSGTPCNTCERGYYRLNAICAKCSSGAWVYVLLFSVAIMLAMLLGVWLNKRRINLAALGIGVDFAQVVAMFVSLNFTWPTQLKSVFSSISLFNFNIQILQPECSVNWDYSMKFALIASLPVVALIATFVVFLMIAAKNLCLEAYERYKGRSLSPPTEVDSLYGLCFACFYYLYLQVVKNAMEPLDCLQLADGRSVMQADPAIECVSSNSTYVLLKLWAIVCLAGYGIGIPIMFVIVLFVYRKEIKVDQDLRAQALGYSTASNPYYHVRRRFQKLYSDFKPHRQYWRLVLLMRKLLLAGTVTLFKSYPSFQAAVAIAIMYGAYVLHTWVKPYMYRENVPNAFFDIVDREFAQAKQPRDLLLMVEKAQKPIVRYIFNYNTLEAISITISMSIVLCGLMFTSGAIPPGSWGYWLLVVFVAGVICLAILAMILLVIFESYRAFKFSALYQRISDFTERKMVKRVTTSASGAASMQIGFGGSGPAGKKGSKPGVLTPPSSDSGMEGIQRQKMNHLFTAPPVPNVAFNPMMSPGANVQRAVIESDASGFSSNPLAKSRVDRLADKQAQEKQIEMSAPATPGQKPAAATSNPLAVARQASVSALPPPPPPTTAPKPSKGKESTTVDVVLSSSSSGGLDFSTPMLPGFSGRRPSINPQSQRKLGVSVPVPSSPTAAASRRASVSVGSSSSSLLPPSDVTAVNPLARRGTIASAPQPSPPSPPPRTDIPPTVVKPDPTPKSRGDATKTHIRLDQSAV